MQNPVQITFRNMQSSDAVEACIHEEVAKLETFYDRIISCRVTVETRRPRQAHGHLHHVNIELHVPGGEIIAGHEPSLHSSMQKKGEEKGRKARDTAAAHRDVFLAVRDAFKAARRRLQDFAQKQDGRVKTHEPGLGETEEENAPAGARALLAPRRMGYL